MDILSEMIELMRVKGNIYGKFHLKGDFHVCVPVKQGMFLLLQEGRCYLQIDEDPNLHLAPGDFIFLPLSKSFILKTHEKPEIPVNVIAEDCQREHHRTSELTYHGSDGEVVSFIVGFFNFSSPENQLLVSLLPNAIHYPAEYIQANAVLAGILNLLSDEADEKLPGYTSVVDRLSEVLLVFALRRNCGQAPPGWLRALTDQQISLAIQEIHLAPSYPWTIDKLAKVVGMSRSAFTAKFKLLVGATPMEHLTQWRLFKAASMLRSRKPVKLEAVAREVGYSSESAFRKVFKKNLGMLPSEYRLKNISFMQ